MKNLLSFTAIASLFVASQASANFYYADVDFIGAKIDGNNPYTSSFNITDNGSDSILDILALFDDNNPGNVYSDGYNPATEFVTAAEAFFFITDDSFFDGRERYSIDLGGVFSTGNAAFNLVLGSVSLTGVADLSIDGIINYTVSSTQGDFMLWNAGLRATVATVGGQPVPDAGSTLALLGLGILGLVTARKSSQTGSEQPNR